MVYNFRLRNRLMAEMIDTETEPESDRFLELIKATDDDSKIQKYQKIDSVKGTWHVIKEQEKDVNYLILTDNTTEK